jgi:hypothetical protein
MLVARTLTAREKSPATTNLGDIGPEPSGSHVVVAYTGPLTPGMEAVVESKGSHTGGHWAGLGKAKARTPTSAINISFIIRSSP